VVEAHHRGVTRSRASRPDFSEALAVVEKRLALLKYTAASGVGCRMLGFLLWVLLLVLCWPLALLALLLYPIVWLLLLPFRLLGIAVDGVLGLVKAILVLPARLLGGPSSVRR
jgi:hypothetical protein